jgi:hypothetical protein
VPNPQKTKEQELNRTAMPLFVVLHHRNDPAQPWANDWVDDDLIATITTTAHIGSLCLQSKSADEQVFVHRCAYGGSPAVISCSVRVSAVHGLPGGGALVQFSDAIRLNQVPPGNPVQGQNYY